MLLTLLYHQISRGKGGNSLSLLEEHFAWISKRYPTVLPGDKLSSKKTLCLTFDDATFDFYHSIFPLLQKYQLKALLAVPTAFIPHTTSLSPEKRLNKIAPLISPVSPKPSPAFCTWDELRTLSASPLIQIASHGVSHFPLTSVDVDPEYEYSASKLTLCAQLKVPILAFAYPYGQWNQTLHRLAKKHYPYIFRIGNASNLNWYNTNQLLYRVSADQLSDFKAPFSPLNSLKYSLKFLLNTLRKK